MDQAGARVCIVQDVVMPVQVATIPRRGRLRQDIRHPTKHHHAGLYHPACTNGTRSIVLPMDDMGLGGNDNLLCTGLFCVDAHVPC